MSSYQDIFATGKPIHVFVQEGLKDEQEAARAFANKARSTNTFSASARGRLDRLKGSYHLLIAAEIWCPDCQINLAVMDFMCETQPNIDLAIISKGRAENDLQNELGLDRVLVPVVAILDANYKLIGTFVERPAVVVNDTTGQALIRYKAGDHMNDTLEDVLDVMEHAERSHTQAPTARSM